MMFFIIPLFLLSLFSTMSSGTRRDFVEMADRRKQACKLFRSGKIQADVARELGVSRQSVSRWYSAWCEGGAGALNGTGRAGRLPSIDVKQLKDVERAILKGPLSFGYKTDMWTLQRVAEVIEKQTGILYHPGHVWKILRQLGFSRQRPARRAFLLWGSFVFEGVWEREYRVSWVRGIWGKGIGVVNRYEVW